MITIQTHPGQRIIELGGGANPRFHPNCDCRQCYDAQGNPTVDFTADFDEPLPIQSEEWDAVFSQYALEHVSWRSVRQFLAEVLRILKPGGKAVFITPNTHAQMRWIEDHPQGWDGKDAFESMSCILYGDQDYEDNTHKCYLSPAVIESLLTKVGFQDIIIRTYGERNTDMCTEAVKPINTQTNGKVVERSTAITTPPQRVAPPLLPREEMFDKHYFNGGDKVGGYFREGYRDFPVHQLTFQHVMARKPESVLELGCARGHILKRLQDAGIRACGLEISKHCWLTRACNGIIRHDVCETPWPWKDKEFDLCFSIAFLEHIPEEFLPAVIKEMNRVSRRCLHGIDFGEHDDGKDLTHCTLRSKAWWENQFAQVYPTRTGTFECVQIINKEELEKGEFPREYLEGDGSLKLNLGSHMCMYPWGWINGDIIDLTAFAQANGYKFRRMDVSQGIPYPTGAVKLITLSHVLEHFTYDQGLRLLRECRRVLDPHHGAIRIAVPDAALLTSLYHGNHNTLSLSDLDEINDGAEKATTPAGKLWALLFEAHLACYDELTLKHSLEQAGFQYIHSEFCQDYGHPGMHQIKIEGTDGFPCLSLYGNGIPLKG